MSRSPEPLHQHRGPAALLHSGLASPLPPAYKVNGPQIRTITGSITGRPFRPLARGTRRIFLGRHTRGGGVIAVHADEPGEITSLSLTRTRRVLFPCPGSARGRRHSHRRMCFANDVAEGIHVAIKAPVTYLRITGYNGLNKLPPGRYRVFANVRAQNAFSGQSRPLVGHVQVK